MNRRIQRYMKRVGACMIVLLSVCGIALADGGRLRFSKTAGPFLVTLFTTPEPLTPGLADFSVMVQDSADGRILSDTIVQMNLTGQDGKAIHAQATRGIATNQLLEAAEIDLPSPGNWHLQIKVEQGNRSAMCDADIPIEPGSRKTVLVWIFALLPLLAVVLFSLHQRQKDLTRTRHVPTN